MASKRTSKPSRTRAAGTSQSTGEGGQARPANSNTTSKYEPGQLGNSIPAGSYSGVPIVAPTPANIVEHPIATVPPGQGTGVAAPADPGDVGSGSGGEY